MMTNHEFITNKSEVYALIALMQLNSSRFKAREDENGNVFVLSQQDRSLWDLHLMERGFSNLEKAAQSPQISKYLTIFTINFQSNFYRSGPPLLDPLVSISSRRPVSLTQSGATKSKSVTIPR